MRKAPRINRFLWRGVPTALFVVLISAFCSAKDTYIAPQAEVFISHNNLFRSHFIASGNWLASESKFSSAWGQVDVDFGLVPFFRRYLFKDPNVDKSKLLTCRVGYLQVSDLKSDPNGFDEKRPFAEIIFRVPVGRAWLFEDRNREEFRFVNNNDSARYRNRLRVERNFVIKKFKFTPYTTGEIFYDGKLDEWNEFQGAFGVDFPWRNKTIIELECMAQIVDGHYSTLSFAFVVQKHL